MNVAIELSANFKREYRRLAKKYRSLEDDVEALVNSIIQTPTLGTDLGHNLRKVRLTIASKGKGKSGGARVITHVLLSVEQGTVHFLTIYDKSERSNITDKELRALLTDCGL